MSTQRHVGKRVECDNCAFTEFSVYYNEDNDKVFIYCLGCKQFLSQLGDAPIPKKLVDIPEEDWMSK